VRDFEIRNSRFEIPNPFGILYILAQTFFFVDFKTPDIWNNLSTKANIFPF
jgi:hypothetical protein